MDTKVTRNDDTNRYELYADGELAGYLKFARRDGVVALIHTEVDARFQGQGLAGTLARTVLDELREAGESVLPFCEYVSSYIARHPEYIDLVPAEVRANFGIEAGATTA